MASLEEIVEIIKNLGLEETALKNTLNMGEVKEIPKCLFPNEQIDFVKMVDFSGNPNSLGMCLLVITNQRFFIIDKKMFGSKIYDFFYNKIVNLEASRSVGMLRISFTLQNDKTESISIKDDQWGNKIYGLLASRV